MDIRPDFIYQFWKLSPIQFNFMENTMYTKFQSPNTNPTFNDSEICLNGLSNI